MHCFIVLLTCVVSLAYGQPVTHWEHTYGGSGDDACNSVIRAANGDYLMAGYSTSFGNGSHDLWLMKTNADGDSLWCHTFGDNRQNWGCFVDEAEDGGIVMAGSRILPDSGDFNFWMIRTDPTGQAVLWNRHYGKPYTAAQEFCNAACATYDGGYALAGYTTAFDGDWENAGDPDFWLVRTSSSGDSLWSYPYGGDGWDICHSVAPAGTGFILGGYTGVPGTGADAMIVRTDENGSVIWSRTYGGAGEDVCYAVKGTYWDGGYVAVGWTSSIDGTPRGWMMKLDADGDSAWSYVYVGNGPAYFHDVDIAGTGGYILVGSEGDNLLVDRLSWWGGDIWSHAWDIGGLAEALSVRWLNGTPRYVICGRAHTGTGGWNAYAMEIQELLAAGDAPAVTAFQLAQNYPNPFNSVTVIPFALSHEGRVELRVFDLTGREVTTIVDAMLPAGSVEAKFDAGALPSGTYIYHLTTSTCSQSRQLVLLK